jgi:hypothetical protein
MIAPVVAAAAVTSARRLLHRRSRRLLVASLLRRQPVSAARELPGQPGHREDRGPGHAGFEPQEFIVLAGVTAGYSCIRRSQASECVLEAT